MILSFRLGSVKRRGSILRAMQNDPRAEWERLMRLYAEMGDEELLEIAGDFGNLTETAQQVLRDELRKWRLPQPAAKKQEAAQGGTAVFSKREKKAGVTAWATQAAGDNARDRDDEGPHGYTWKTTLCECESKGRAWQISEVLKQAGIENWIEVSSVLVAEDQLDEARAIAEQPIPQEIVEQSEAPVEDFEPPRCPQCGAEDPLLLGVDPANTWRCENCGEAWSDPVADAMTPKKAF